LGSSFLLSFISDLSSSSSSHDFFFFFFLFFFSLSQSSLSLWASLFVLQSWRLGWRWEATASEGAAMVIEGGAGFPETSTGSDVGAEMRGEALEVAGFGFLWPGLCGAAHDDLVLCLLQVCDDGWF
jgi:hypothetical protein